MLVGEAPGRVETEVGRPFANDAQGRGAGWCLNGMLKEAGIQREQCYVTNVCKYRPPNDELEGENGRKHVWWTESKTKAQPKEKKVRKAFVGPIRPVERPCPHFADGYYYNDLIAAGLEELRADIVAIKPEVIVGLGNLALWALTGESGIVNWRGSEMWWKGAALTGTSIPVIPTLHPSFITRMWEWRAAAVQDLRARVMGKMGKPKEREEPGYRFLIPTTVEEGIEFLQGLSRRIAAVDQFDLTCDVETRGGRIACVGFGWSELDAMCIPLRHCDGTPYWDEVGEQRLVGFMKNIMFHPVVHLINQNFNYDRQYFVADPAFRFKPRCHYDTQIGQHLLYPGSPKNIAYQSSLYCKHHRFWKEEGKEITTDDEQRWWVYNCIDCVRTWEVSKVTRRLLVRAGFAEAGI